MPRNSAEANSPAYKEVCENKVNFRNHPGTRPEDLTISESWIILRIFKVGKYGLIVQQESKAGFPSKKQKRQPNMPPHQKLC